MEYNNIVERQALMRDKKQLIIFARAPNYGEVKQRLARDIGKAEALRFYEATLAALISNLKAGPWSLCVSVATPEAQAHPAFANVDTICQPEGDLGVRMKSALDAFAGSGKARIIVGSDIPSITRTHISNAFYALTTNDLVFGPAKDGGFWLVGCASSYPRPSSGYENVMKNVRWSTDQALADTLDSVPSHNRVALIDTLSDVDDGNSYMNECYLPDSRVS